MVYDLIDAYKQRNNIVIRPYVLVKGKRVLMYIKRNPFIKYIDNDNYLLSDGINDYGLSFKKDHIEIIEGKEYLNNTIDLGRINPFLID